MRHQKKEQKLKRDKAHRKALFKNLVAHLFLHGEIKTTLPKAKAIKGLADRLISQVEKASLHRRRLIESFLQNRKAVEKLFSEIGPQLSKRVGGFTQIVRLGSRRGDGAEMAKIELVEKGEKEKKEGKEKEKKGGQGATKNQSHQKK